MRLKSCDNCGIVLDISKIEIPNKDKMYDENAETNYEFANWSSSKQCIVPMIRCPVCKSEILIED